MSATLRIPSTKWSGGERSEPEKQWPKFVLDNDPDAKIGLESQFPISPRTERSLHLPDERDFIEGDEIPFVVAGTLVAPATISES